MSSPTTTHHDTPIINSPSKSPTLPPRAAPIQASTCPLPHSPKPHLPHQPLPPLSPLRLTEKHASRTSLERPLTATDPSVVLPPVPAPASAEEPPHFVPQGAEEDLMEVLMERAKRQSF
ncbi:unnamed protein product [Agarophyton chilense]